MYNDSRTESYRTVVLQHSKVNVHYTLRQKNTQYHNVLTFETFPLRCENLYCGLYSLFLDNVAPVSVVKDVVVFRHLYTKNRKGEVYTFPGNTFVTSVLDSVEWIQKRSKHPKKRFINTCTK